jgi:hypothetical protein
MEERISQFDFLPPINFFLARIGLQKRYHPLKKTIVTCFMIFAIFIPAACCQAQRSSPANVSLGQSVDDVLLLKERIADQLYLYKEVMEHLSDLSERFSHGYIDPDAAIKKVMVLKHAYNSESDPVPPEARELHERMNRMFSRLTNYFIYFKRAYREDPYLNAKIAETRFYAAQEAERLEYTYLR